MLIIKLQESNVFALKCEKNDILHNSIIIRWVFSALRTLSMCLTDYTVQCRTLLVSLQCVFFYSNKDSPPLGMSVCYMCTEGRGFFVLFPMLRGRAREQGWASNS